MKLSVKTLKGQQFDVEVDATAKVAQVKEAIEAAKGKEHFPASQQKLIHQGKVLKDDTTLEEGNVTEASFVVVMVVQPKPGQASSSGAATQRAPAAAAVPAPAPTPAPAPAPTPSPAAQAPPAAAPAAESTPAAAAAPGAAPTAASAGAEDYREEQAASTLLAGSALEGTIQQILEMGGGGWDRAMVLRALRAAFNNPERAIEYLYSGIPETAEVPPPVARESAAPPAAGPAAAGVPAAAGAPAAAAGGAAPGVPNVTPFNIFGEQPAAGGAAAAAPPGALDFLRNSPQFQGLRAMVQTNPGLLQPMLQELGKQNPDLARMIAQNQAEFLRMLNEPPSEADLLQLAAAAAAAQGQPPPVALNVTPEEGEAISRLEAMGFDRQLVIEAFFACDKNEQLAANYLLEHGAEFED